jgi:DNA-binding NarL/FixJ family response regulator
MPRAGAGKLRLRGWLSARAGWVFPPPAPPRARDDLDVVGSVLIVDDDPAFRALAGRLLSDRGFVVVGEAETVAGALEMATRIRPSAALVDVGLPDGDGFTLARQLTALPWQPRVVLTSMHPNVGSSAEVRRSGALAFVHKGDLPRAPLVQWFGAE